MKKKQIMYFVISETQFKIRYIEKNEKAGKKAGKSGIRIKNPIRKTGTCFRVDIQKIYV